MLHESLQLQWYENDAEVEISPSSLVKLWREKIGLLKSIPGYCKLTAEKVSDLLLEALQSAKKNDDDGRKASLMLAEVYDIIRKQRLYLNYHDLCNLFKMQSCQGGYYSLNPSHASGKGTLILRKYAKTHPGDVNLMFAAIFSGFEELLPDGYEHYYYTLAKAKGHKNPYFRENLLSLVGITLPYHAVYAAICKELPDSVYTQTSRAIEGRIKQGMLGFPDVWRYYTWDLLTADHPELQLKFREMHGRSVRPGDLILASLTHINQHHGLQMMDKEECPVLKAWFESLPGKDRNDLKEFEAKDLLNQDNKRDYICKAALAENNRVFNLV